MMMVAGPADRVVRSADRVMPSPGLTVRDPPIYRGPQTILSCFVQNELLSRPGKPLPVPYDVCEVTV